VSAGLVPLRARDVVKAYGRGGLQVEVLHGVSLSLAPGELTLLMGPSGSGKTTLISLCAGLLRADGGEVELCGHRISGMSDAEVARVRRRHLGFVFQDASLFPALTALDNVTEILLMKGGGRRRDARERAAIALDAMHLGHRLHHKPAQMSGGEKQRVAIARALAGDPDLVLGDEVTAALDGHTAMSVLELLRAQLGPRRTMLLVTHDHRLEPYADRVIRMEDGQVVGDGPGGWGRTTEVS